MLAIMSLHLYRSTVVKRGWQIEPHHTAGDTGIQYSQKCCRCLRYIGWFGSSREKRSESWYAQLGQLTKLPSLLLTLCCVWGRHGADLLNEQNSFHPLSNRSRMFRRERPRLTQRTPALTCWAYSICKAKKCLLIPLSVSIFAMHWFGLCMFVFHWKGLSCRVDKSCMASDGLLTPFKSR